jgi:hypothetical protein
LIVEDLSTIQLIEATKASLLPSEYFPGITSFTILLLIRLQIQNKESAVLLPKSFQIKQFHRIRPELISRVRTPRPESNSVHSFPTNIPTPLSRMSNIYLTYSWSITKYDAMHTSNSTCNRATVTEPSYVPHSMPNAVDSKKRQKDMYSCTALQGQRDLQ